MKKVDKIGPVDEADRITQHLEGKRYRLDGLNVKLRDLRGQMRSLEDEERELLDEIARIEGAIEALEGLQEEEADEDLKKEKAEWQSTAELGIQEACYRVLVDSKEPLSAKEIMYELIQRGVTKVKDYANAPAVIHTTLSRIGDRVKSKKRKVRVTDDQEGWVRYYEAVKPVPETAPKQ